VGSKPNYGFALGLAGQMLATILLGLGLGRLLDPSDPPKWGQIIGALIGTVVAMVAAIMQVKKNENL
jgi:F0F1-type ATP synthase assembly protein I